MGEYKLYIHINKINGKKYIGITKESPNRRWRKGKGYKSNSHFTLAIKKYGWDNFYHIVAIDGLTQSQACILERMFILIYRSNNKYFGYNSTSGGEKNYYRTEETKQTGSKNPMFGKFGDKNPFFGKVHSQESLATMRRKKKGGNNPNAKKVMCLNTRVIFPSCREASEWCNIPRQNIHRCCAGIRPTAGKHPISKEKLKWRYLDNEI